MKNKIFTIIIISILCTGWILFAINCHKAENLYSLTTVVVHISEATDTVTIKDFNGNLWQFKGVEDWAIDDICSCVMDSRNTVLIKDDIIVDTRYCGWFEGWK